MVELTRWDDSGQGQDRIGDGPRASRLMPRRPALNPTVPVHSLFQNGKDVRHVCSCFEPTRHSTFYPRSTIKFVPLPTFSKG